MKLSPFRLERFFAAHEFSAPYLLCGSDCETLSISELLRYSPEAEADFTDLRLGYTESAGDPILRKEIADLYDSIGPEDVLVHSGAEEAIHNFMHAMIEPGDHVIVHSPCYQSLYDVAAAIGCRMTRWPARPEEDFQPDPDFVRDRIKPNTRALIINFPHNPTGALLSRDRFEAIVALSRKHGFIVFSDEVYRFLEYDETARLPALAEIDDRGVSLSVMSKSFGLAGLRIGWIATKNPDIYRRMSEYKDYTTICNSAPSEFLAALALRHKTRILARNRQIIQDNLKALTDFFSRHQHRFHWYPPKGGPIAFPALKTEPNAEDFCRALLSAAGVLLLPGTVYHDAEQHFRIGFGKSNFGESLRRFEAFLDGS
jgi:aspartate/methionine/tyrosine aminotransferase